MPQCPQCSKQLRELVRRCPTCQADLDLLVDYVSHLNGGLDRAENLTRAGELGQAFWAYLEVLEVDPDNAPAKKQVSQVVTAVRQFDQVNQGRRWLAEIRHGPPRKPIWPALPNWVLASLCGGLVALAFAAGYILGFNAPVTEAGDPKPDTPPKMQRQDDLMGPALQPKPDAE